MWFPLFDNDNKQVYDKWRLVSLSVRFDLVQYVYKDKCTFEIHILSV